MTPSPFVIQWAPWVAAHLAADGAHRALDVAMGRGRHVEALACAGFTVYGVDRDLSTVRDAVARGAELGLAIRAWCTDLATCSLPERRFDLVLVTRYLQRDLFASLREAVRPGGFVIYETFTRDQIRYGRGPTSPDHLLVPGELPSLFEGFQVVFYEEVNEPEALARLVARREA
jgi:SAM-dependent methyltransferase